MTKVGYRDREEFEMENWPELRESMNNIFKLVFPGREVSGELKQFVFTAASLASGCLHCQSHGSYHLHWIGVSDAKIQAMWRYQESDLFDDAERAALDLAFAAGVAPTRWNRNILRNSANISLIFKSLKFWLSLRSAGS